MVNQNYFTPSDVGEIVDRLMSLPIAGGVSGDKTVAATQALNAVRILRDRLEAESEVLRFIYTDETITPRPIVKFIQDYLDGKYKLGEAEKIIDGLQADMRQNYFQRRITFGDPSELPRTRVLDLKGDFAQKTKEIVEKTVAEYDPKADSKARAEEIYRKACENPTGEIDFDALANGLAEVMVRREYSTLILSVGTRDPTAGELAGRYLNALDAAYRRLGSSKDIDRESVLERRTTEEVYRRELQVYKDNLGGLVL